MAALATAVVVVEAGYRCGTLSLANHALGMRRIVAAVPSPVRSAASVGCHRLIHDGETRLIATADDLVALIDARYP
ncbi:MAG: DNA-processing protein DprA [Cellulomonadaceae bacterium]